MQTTVPSLDLNDGHSIPQFGLGVWQMDSADADQLIGKALEIGYRHIDTAAIYKNEADVGRAIANANIPREQLFITTKLWNADQGRDTVAKALDDSLKKLGLEYVDLYLIHWPVPQNDLYLQSWEALIRARESGKIRSIGVSNFRIDDLRRIIDATQVVPAVNQIELHPLFQQRVLQAAHEKLGIVTQAWSPLAQGGDLLQDPRLVDIAKHYNKSTAQVILRWHIQQRRVVFPKSSNPSRMRENFNIFDFELSAQDMTVIDALDADKRIGPNPESFAG